MENDAVGSGSLFQSADRESFFVGFGITSADKDDTACRTRVHHQCFFVQVACGSAFKQFYEVALNAKHHAFCFRVAHADVVFDHHRFTFHLDETEEDEAFVGDIFFFQAVDGRLNDAGANFLHIHFIGKRDGGYATHTACIQSFIAFTDAFVIFGYGEDFIVFSVCQYEYRTFDTA